MNLKYFDIHAHLQFPQFDTDREKLIQTLQENETGVINVGTGRETSLQAVELAKNHEHLWAVVGLHPTHNDEVFDLEFFTNLAREEKVVAIGECGIDLFRADKDSLYKQVDIFEKHLEIGRTIGKPIMLHIRPSPSASMDAYTEAIEVLKKYPDVKAHVHFFAGDIDVAKQFLDLGHTLSFTGAITYPKSEQYHEVIRYAPLDMIMAETDCPFVAPVPYRGTRCNPSMVIEVYKKIAEVKNIPLEQVLEQVRSNVKRVFGI